MTGTRLSEKVAVVTGAARGLGRACAVRFAEEGADLVLLDVGGADTGIPYPVASAAQLEHTAGLCREHGAAVLVAEADVRSASQTGRAVETAYDRFGRIDVLVNNAGIATPAGKPVHEIGQEEWQVMIDIDLTGSWHMIKAVAPVMTQRGSGSIINVASTAGLVGYRDFAGYVAAKHGLVGLTRAAALDYAPLKVRVNALCPGSVQDDPRVEGRMLGEIASALGVPVEEHEQTFVRDQPMNALLTPEDIAAAAVWLASDESRQVTGTALPVDGGFTAR